jgi:hypothetical protein
MRPAAVIWELLQPRTGNRALCTLVPIEGSFDVLVTCRDGSVVAPLSFVTPDAAIGFAIRLADQLTTHGWRVYES